MATKDELLLPQECEAYTQHHTHTAHQISSHFPVIRQAGCGTRWSVCPHFRPGPGSRLLTQLYDGDGGEMVGEARRRLSVGESEKYDALDAEERERRGGA